MLHLTFIECIYISPDSTVSFICVDFDCVQVTDGVVDVIVYPSAIDKTKNRGFAFVEYESHKAAALARRNLVPGIYKDQNGQKVVLNFMITEKSFIHRQRIQKEHIMI